VDVVRSVAEMREIVAGWRKADESVALVPTMGALHDGHMSLVHSVADKADRTITTIFVNPTQFSPTEDFATYPRDEARDLSMLEQAGVDLVFTPEMSQMYRDGHRTKVEVQALSQLLEGESRPHFFIGVATVVAKLLIQSMPDIAIFGEKDYQQLCVIRSMVRDLDLPVDILGGDTVRESDGLAMSSRNSYLTNVERTLAPRLYHEISGVASRVAKGEPIEIACEDAVQGLDAAGFNSVDYVAVRDAETLEPAAKGRPLRVLAAAWLGKTRLIDNMAVQ